MFSNHDGVPSDSFRGAVDRRFDAVKSGIKTWVDRVATTPSGGPSRIRSAFTKTGSLISAHPVAAIAVALGLGYTAARLVRR